MNDVFKEEELVYAAFARCRCGKGLAYVPQKMDFWACSYLLKNPVKFHLEQEAKSIFDAGVLKDETDVEHDGGYDFRLFEIKSERQPSAGGSTTREC